MTGIPSWARVGAKVVCVDDKPDNGRRLPIREGERYTISGARTNTFIGGDHVTVLLTEIDPPNEFWIERFKSADRLSSILDALNR